MRSYGPLSRRLATVAATAALLLLAGAGLYANGPKPPPAGPMIRPNPDPFPPLYLVQEQSGGSITGLQRVGQFILENTRDYLINAGRENAGMIPAELTSCFLCHPNGHTNGSFAPAPDGSLLRYEAPSIRGAAYSPPYAFKRQIPPRSRASRSPIFPRRPVRRNGRRLSRRSANRPDFADAYCFLGEAYLKQGKVNEAVEALNRGIRLGPKSSLTRSESYLYLSDALLARGDLRGALEAVDQSLARRRESPAAHRRQAKLLGRLGRKKEEADAIRAYLNLAPDAPDADRLRSRIAEAE